MRGQRTTLSLTDLPPMYLDIESGAGRAAPTQTTALPAISKDTVLGVLEIAPSAHSRHGSARCSTSCCPRSA